MTSPSHRDKTSFQSELRKHDAELHVLSQENFDLKLKLHQLQHQVQVKTERRRDSATPPPDNFYDYNDDDDNAAEQINVSTLDNNNPILRKLRAEVSDLRSENEHLTERNDHLNDALDDLREQSVSAIEKAEQKLKTQHLEMQSLVNQAEDLQSDNLQLKVEIQQAKTVVKATKEEMEKEKEEGITQHRREKSMRARADGLAIQLNAFRASMEEMKEKTQVSSKQMGERQVEIVKLRNELREKGFELDKLKSEMEATRAEKGGLKEALEREKERAGIWKEAGELVERGELLFGGGGGLEELIVGLKKQSNRYERIEYEPRWREMIMDDLNDCLRVLYRSQREVEAKRQVVWDTFCDPTLRQRNALQVS